MLERKEIQHYEPMDYVCTPFRCVRCHLYGHLARDYILNFSKKVCVRKEDMVLTPTRDKSYVPPKYYFGNDSIVSSKDLIGAMVSQKEVEEVLAFSMEKVRSLKLNDM